MKHPRIFNLTKTLVLICYLALIIFSSTIHFIPYIEFHDYQRVIQLFLLVLVLIDGVVEMLIVNNANQYTANATIINKNLQLGIYSVLVLGVLSSIHAIEPRQAAIEVSIFISLCYLALFVTRLQISFPQVFVKYLSCALWASIGLYMVSFYTGYLTAMAVGKQLVWPYPFFGFSNIRTFQQYQLWGMGLICLPLLTFNLKSNHRKMLFFVLMLWWVLLFYAASRGVILGWILAITVTAIIYKMQAWTFLRTQLITAAGGLLGYLILFKAIPQLIADSAASALSSASNVITTATIFRNTVSDRTDLWKVAYVMIKNFPLLGVGPMHFYFYNPFGTHPHNSILQIAAEWGLPVTIIMLGIIVYAFKCWFKQFGPKRLLNKAPLNQQLAIILFFTIVANGAYSLVDGVIVMPISQVLMFTMIGLMIGQYVSGEWYIRKVEPAKKFHFRSILAGVTLIFLVWSVMPELVRGLTSYDRYLQPGERAFSMAPNTINPRIWMQQRRPEPSSSHSAN